MDPNKTEELHLQATCVRFAATGRSAKTPHGLLCTETQRQVESGVKQACSIAFCFRVPRELQDVLRGHEQQRAVCRVQRQVRALLRQYVLHW